MKNSGFYKKENNQILFSETLVCGPNYTLIDSDHEKYEYPVDGWIWAENLDDAIYKFNAQNNASTEPFLVEPENFYMDTSSSSEVEFNKLTTLIQISLSLNSINHSSLIKLKDKNGFTQEISVDRFLEIMVAYGFFCYNKRNL